MMYESFESYTPVTAATNISQRMVLLGVPLSDTDVRTLVTEFPAASVIMSVAIWTVTSVRDKTKAVCKCLNEHYNHENALQGCLLVTREY